MMRQYEFIELNKSKGLHWFDKDTLRFFKSRVSNWDCISGLFISSERGPDMVRKYTVRKADFETGNVSTVGEFQQYRTIKAAKGAMKRAQRGII